MTLVELVAQGILMKTQEWQLSVSNQELVKYALIYELSMVIKKARVQYDEV